MDGVACFAVPATNPTGVTYSVVTTERVAQLRAAACTLPLKSTQMINLLGNTGSNLLKPQFRNGGVIDTKVAELAQTFDYITVD